MVANGMVQVAVPAWLIATGVLAGGPAAAVLMAMTLTMAAMGPATGRAPRIPYGRWFRGGLLGCGVGLAVIAAATVWAWWVTLPALVVVGLGAGALLSPSLTAFSHTVAGENVLGSPLLAALYLLQVLRTQDQFEPVQAGEIVTTGTLLSPPTIRASSSTARASAGVSSAGAASTRSADASVPACAPPASRG